MYVPRGLSSKLREKIRRPVRWQGIGRFDLRNEGVLPAVARMADLQGVNPEGIDSPMSVAPDRDDSLWLE